MSVIEVGAGEEKKIVIVHSEDSARKESQERTIRLLHPSASVVVEEFFCSGAKSNVTIIHEAKNTSSRIITRGVARCGDIIVANSRIIIPKGSSGSKTRVEQSFLLLDGSSRVRATPSLEIEEDDVLAGHCASISPISEDAIAYLASRGFDRKVAEGMIVEGFLKGGAG
ncbi:SufD family Fe-S cluster assembly protein [Candidatus Woesearchaeota archaeon]|nr:MAG: SufD family Fe-S cluster assembly protein [Candidatus Woesearchaeota archaeon]